MTKSIRSPDSVSGAVVRYGRCSGEPAGVPVPVIGTWFDTSGNAIDGRSNDPALFETFAFGGVVDYVLAPYPYAEGGIGGVLPISQDLATATVEAWFKPAAIGSNMRIVSIHSASSLNALSVGVRAAGDLFFQVQNSSRGDSLSAMVAGAWAHVACTVGPGVAPIVYVNGADDTNTSSASWPPSSTYQIGIGATLYGGGPFLSQPFQGDIDTVRVYDRVLSPDEVLKNYNAGRAAHQ